MKIADGQQSSAAVNAARLAGELLFRTGITVADGTVTRLNYPALPTSGHGIAANPVRE